jgi:predicted AAA+ superfamily ATPase
MRKRLIWEELQKELEQPEILVLTGPRQVGKTTTLKWLLNQIESTNKIYIDLQNILNQTLFETSNYDTIIQELEKRGLSSKNKIYIAIDEIQILPTLPGAVKYLHDNYDLKFILTGSSSYYIKNKFNESMAGRKVVYELLPLRFQEFLTFKNFDYKLDQNFNKTKIDNYRYELLQNYYNEYIKYGGLPKVALEPDIGRKKQILEEIYSSYIHIDVQQLADFKSIDTLTKLVKLLAIRTGNRLNSTNLAKILGVTRITIDNYLTFLEQTYLIKQIKGFSKSVDVQTRIPNKIYFTDTGIATINADISEGAMFENTVAHQLRFYGEVTYYQDSNSEIDFILNKETAYEIKLNPTDKYVPKLKKTSDKLGIKETHLIGKYQTAKFNEYIWGGDIG